MKFKLPASNLEIEISSYYCPHYGDKEQAKINLNISGQTNFQFEFRLQNFECDMIIQELNKYGTFKQNSDDERL